MSCLNIVWIPIYRRKLVKEEGGENQRRTKHRDMNEGWWSLLLTMNVLQSDHILLPFSVPITPRFAMNMEVTLARRVWVAVTYHFKMETFKNQSLIGLTLPSPASGGKLHLLTSLKVSVEQSPLSTKLRCEWEINLLLRLWNLGILCFHTVSNFLFTERGDYNMNSYLSPSSFNN